MYLVITVLRKAGLLLVVVTRYKFDKSNKYLSMLESFKVVNLMMCVLFWLH